MNLATLLIFETLTQTFRRYLVSTIFTQVQSRFFFFIKVGVANIRLSLTGAVWLSNRENMELVPSKYLEDSVTDLLCSKSPAHGLALLIGCKTSFNPKHSPLEGVEGDLYLLKNTFSKLGFDTVNLLDPTREEIIKVVDLIARKFPVPMQNNTMHPSYRHIVVTFSGHGDLCQVFSKNSSLNLKEEIVNPLVNTDPVVSKLFFVDACRGDKIDPGIGYNIRDFIDGGSPGRIVARGANEIRLPSRGNYLLAFSTLPGMKSFEDNECGSFWMQLLCRALLENDGKSSILDLLTVVNQKLILKFNEMISTLQQPIFMSCLNDVIRFERTYVEGNLLSKQVLTISCTVNCVMCYEQKI